MPVEAVVALILIAVIANLVLMGVLIAPYFGRPEARGTRARPASAEPPRPEPLPTADLVETAPEPAAGAPRDRIVRIASWVFLIGTGTVVAATGLWPTTQTAILAMLVVAAAFVVVLHDLLPADALGHSRFAVEGTVALTGAAALVALTGGVDSPFFFTFPLIVAGSALVVTPRVTIVLTVAGAVGFLVAIALGSAAGALDARSTAGIAVDLMALLLLTYVAMVIAREQRAARDAAIRLSTIDPLTGLFNRSYFFAAIEREIARSARSGRGFCLLMMDLDELKAINDRLGHFHGDRVLRGVGEVIAQGVRRIDTAARYGGDEFVVLLPETDPTGAFVLAEKIRIGVRSMSLDLPGDAPRPSMSIGVVAYPHDGGTVDDLMISADGAMYASKRAGKDRVTGVAVPAIRIA